MVSFTGKFDIEVLRELSKGNASEISECPIEITKDLTRRAQRARDRLRYAESLRRRQIAGRGTFSAKQQYELALLADDTLRKQANEATRISGFGRIKHEDGRFEDIARHGRGILRTLLDHMSPNFADDDDTHTDD